MYDLVVVGGGYWGVGIALEAQAKGWTVAVLDDKDRLGGSRNASAVCDPKAYESDIFAKYLPDDWTAADLKESFAWLVAHGGKVTHEFFLNKFQDRPMRKGNDAIYLDSNNVLLSQVKPIEEKVVSMEKRGIVWDLKAKSGTIYRARKVAIAAGYRTEGLLRFLDLPHISVGKLYGRGVIARGMPTCEIPVSVMIRPYTKHTIRPWGKLLRIGDTAEGDQPNDKRAGDIQEVGNAVIEGYDELEWVAGYRPTCDKFLVEKVAPGVVVATGGHRLGLGLTGLVARKALECLS